MKVVVAREAQNGEYDREFGFYLDAWIFLFLAALVGIFLFLTIYITRRVKREFYTRTLGDFEKNYGYSYDYVFVFKVYPEDEIEHLNEDQLTYSMKNIVDRMENAHLEYSCFYSCQRDEIYVKVRARPNRLLDEAARISYKLELEPKKLQIAASVTVSEDGKIKRKGFTITDTFKISPYEPYKFIYAKYSKDEQLQDVYKKYEVRIDNITKIHFLRPVDRIKLLLSIFEGNVNASPAGCGLQLRKMMLNKVVLSHFPLHDFDELVGLEDRWLKVFSTKQFIPIEDIKNYYGEKIGLYFAFLKYYIGWLRKPALIGLFVYVFSVVVGRTQSYLPAIFGGLFVIWCTLMAENWKGKQATIAMEWGTTGFEDEEQERAEFVGEEITSPIDGSKMLYYSSSAQFFVSLFINVVICAFLAIAVAQVVAIVQFQNFLFTTNEVSRAFTIAGENYTPYISAILLVIVMEVLRRIYWQVAVALNEFQNHRTDTDYEDSLVVTLFVFQFANNYFYPTFVAFAKPFTEYKCVNDDCMLELSSTLTVLSFLPILIHSVEEVIIGKIQQAHKIQQETSDIEPGTTVGLIERQYILSEYNVISGTFQDYSALMSLFGYVAMFVAAFPQGTAIAVLSSEARLRIDGWKLCQAFRRPQPKIAEDIGVWENVMHFISIIAVMYTFAIICFTASYLDNTNKPDRWIYFILLEHAALILKIYLIIAIEDVPEAVRIQLARQEFLVSKVIDNEDDESEDYYNKVESSKSGAGGIEITAYDKDYEMPLRPGETRVSEDAVAMYRLIETKDIFELSTKED